MSNSQDYLAAEARKELDGLRAQLDVRLSALENGLSSPNPATPLAQLVLDLARVATAESQSAARRAVLVAQLEAERTAGAAVSEASRELEQARAELAREREGVSRLRLELSEAQRALGEEQQAAAARERELDQAQAALQSARDAEASHRQQLEQLEEALQRERGRGAAVDAELAEQRDAFAALNADLTAARAALAQSSETVEDLRRELTAARQEHHTRSAADASTTAALDTLERRCAELDANVAAATARADAAIRERDTLATALEDERAGGIALDAELAAERQTIVALSETGEALRAELAAVQHAFETRALDDASVAAALDALERRCGELDATCTTATARADEAVRERDALAAALENERQAGAATRTAFERELADVRSTSAARAADDDVHRSAVSTLERRCAELEQNAAAILAREADAVRERETLGMAVEVERRAAAAAQATGDARIEALTAEQAETERHRQAAEARAEEAQAKHDELAALLASATQSIEGLQASTDAKRTRTQQAWEEAEARAEAATRERDVLAQALTAIKAAPGADPDAARRLEDATERVRILELQLFERERGPEDRDVDLAHLLQAEPPAAAKKPDQPVKEAKRYGFKTPRKIHMDKSPCLLMDLSVTGAQIISAVSPEVGKVVTLSLLSDEAPCFCQGRLLWARREQTAKGRPYRYRTGLVFTAADESAIEAFIARHAVS